MKRAGRSRGELFWCHVSGRALDPRAPHAAGIWAFEDLSSRRELKVDFTAREREIAALLIEGLTSKLIGKRLAISPRTVDVYRARLMRKDGAATTPELVNKLLSALKGSPLIVVHHLENSRSQRVLWLLEELGAELRGEALRARREDHARAARAEGRCTRWASRR